MAHMGACQNPGSQWENSNHHFTKGPVLTFMESTVKVRVLGRTHARCKTYMQCQFRDVSWFGSKDRIGSLYRLGVVYS